MSWRPVAVVVALLLLAAGGGCGSEEERGDPGRRPDNAAYLGVCRALGAAKTGDTDEARTVFDDEAHGPLHDLSAQVDDEDRAIAARLLEAKQAVESAVAEKAGVDELRPALEKLAAATADAVTEVEGEPGPCPG